MKSTLFRMKTLLHYSRLLPLLATSGCVVVSVASGTVSVATTVVGAGVTVASTAVGVTTTVVKTTVNAGAAVVGK